MTAIKNDWRPPGQEEVQRAESGSKSQAIRDAAPAAPNSTLAFLATTYARCTVTLLPDMAAPPCWIAGQSGLHPSRVTAGGRS